MLSRYIVFEIYGKQHWLIHIFTNVLPMTIKLLFKLIYCTFGCWILRYVRPRDFFSHFCLPYHILLVTDKWLTFFAKKEYMFEGIKEKTLKTLS